MRRWSMMISLTSARNSMIEGVGVEMPRPGIANKNTHKQLLRR